MGRLREIVGDDPAGYAAAIAADRPVRAEDPEVQAQVRRYEQECSPVTTRPYIEWLEPQSNATHFDAPVVSITKTGLTFNRPAVELLGRPRRVFVGATVQGEIAVKPAPDGRGYAFNIARKQDKVYSASVGRDALTRRLEERGLQRGSYRLEYNEKLGVWLGRRLE